MNTLHVTSLSKTLIASTDRCEYHCTKLEKTGLTKTTDGIFFVCVGKDRLKPTEDIMTKPIKRDLMDKKQV